MKNNLENKNIFFAWAWVWADCETVPATEDSCSAINITELPSHN